MRSLVRSTSVVALTSFHGATLLMFSVAVLLAGSTAAMRGQSALDGFDPNANSTITVVVVQPDGKILIGGDFTTLSPNGGAVVTRNRIARLNVRTEREYCCLFDRGAGERQDFSGRRSRFSKQQLCATAKSSTAV